MCLLISIVVFYLNSWLNDFEVINYGDIFVIVLVEGYFVGLCLGFNDFDVGEM